MLDIVVAEGSGIAARGSGLLVAKRRRASPDQALPVNMYEWEHLGSTPFGAPSRFAGPGGSLTMAALLTWEDEVAARGELIDGTGLFWLASPRQLMLRIQPDTGDAPLDLPVTGPAAVAMSCPHQACGFPAWIDTPAPWEAAFPDPIRHVLDQVRAANGAIVARPLVQDRIYNGYSLELFGHRIDVTGAAGFVFPLPLLARDHDAEEVRELVARRLHSDEPPDVVTDFDTKYLASAQLAARYRKMRMRS